MTSPSWAVGRRRMMTRRGWVGAAALLVAVLTILGEVGSQSIDESLTEEHAPLTQRVLAVCTGNTCRSAMLMAALRLELERSNRTDVVVHSAGSGKRAAGKPQNPKP